MRSKMLTFRLESAIAYDFRVALAKRDETMQAALTRLIEQYNAETEQLEAAGKLRPE